MTSENESEFNPDWRSAPGETIAELVKMRGISEMMLGLRLRLSRDEVSKLMTGELRIEDDLADRLAALFGNSSAFWINREANYRKPLPNLAEPIEVDGDLGLRLGDQVFKIVKGKPWDDMTEEEREEHIKQGVNFIMGGDADA